MKRIAIRFTHALFYNKAFRLFGSLLRKVAMVLYRINCSNALRRPALDFYIEYPVVIKGSEYIEIGCRFSARARLRIEAWDEYGSKKYKPRISIGDDVTMNFDVHIGSINEVSIGNHVLIGSRVLITDHNHGEFTEPDLLKHPSERDLISKGPVYIEDDVWIGENVSILPNVRIGAGSVIAANSVVTKDIPPRCLAAGVPAKIVKKLSNRER